MQLPLWLARIVGVLLAVLTPLVSGVMGLFTRPSDPAPAAVMEMTDGFITGICHPEEQFDLINGANIGWIREDIPYPYGEDGELSPWYLSWKEEMQRYADHGIRIFAVTPYPNTYLEHGLDCRKPEDMEKIVESAKFMLEDLRDLVGALQITNEMGVDRFTKPFTLEEASVFIGEQLKALYPIRGDIIIGYNLGGPDGVMKIPPLMKEYNDFCDYVGVDIYFGSFENFVKNIDTHLLVLKYVRLVSKKPIIMTEFGYIGYGEPKTKAEKQAILQKYGFDSEEAVRADVDTFISRLPERIKAEFEEYYADRSAEEKADLLFKGEFANHIYCELSQGTGLYGYPHSPEGQAKYFTRLIKKMRSYPWCCGAIVYMWNDSKACYVCGQSDCPVETGWGIVDGEGNPKAGYYAVRDAFAD